MKARFVVFRIFDCIYSFRYFSYKRKVYWKGNIKALTNHEIEQCIKILPSKYSDMKVKIVFPQNIIVAILMHILPFNGCPVENIYFILATTGMGYYFYLTKTICIFHDKLRNLSSDIENKEKYIKLHITYCLYHELQHAYQHHYNKEMLSNGGVSIIDKNYKTHITEVDANSFADKIMNENREYFIHLYDAYFEYIKDGVVYI